MSGEEQQARWRGEFTLPVGTWARWRVGPLEVMARRQIAEWRFAWRYVADILDDTVEYGLPAGFEPDDETHEFRRFALQRPGEKLEIRPLLADRPVVVRPETPLFVPPSERAVLFVGTVVWLCLSSVAGRICLMEVPSFQLSDTWFGKDTVSGEYCYASRTRARTQVELIQTMPHRAITPVEIVNDGIDVLHVERLQVPVRALRLLEADDGTLWTDAVKFVRSEGETSASLEVLDQNSEFTEGATVVSAARNPIPRHTVVQAFGRLLGAAGLR